MTEYFMCRADALHIKIEMLSHRAKGKINLLQLPSCASHRKYTICVMQIYIERAWEHVKDRENDNNKKKTRETISIYVCGLTVQTQQRMRIMFSRNENKKKNNMKTQNVTTISIWLVNLRLMHWPHLLLSADENCATSLSCNEIDCSITRIYHNRHSPQL